MRARSSALHPFLIPFPFSQQSRIPSLGRVSRPSARSNSYHSPRLSRSLTRRHDSRRYGIAIGQPTTSVIPSLHAARPATHHFLDTVASATHLLSPLAVHITIVPRFRRRSCIPSTIKSHTVYLLHYPPRYLPAPLDYSTILPRTGNVYTPVLLMLRLRV